MTPRTLLAAALTLAVLALAGPGHTNIIGGGAPRIAPPGPMPPGFDPIDMVLDNVRVLPSVSDGWVQFFPLTAPGDVHLRRRLMTLHDAFAQGKIRLLETGPGDQFWVSLANVGEDPVFGQGGQFMGGGGQDRFNRMSFIAPPGGEPIRLAVYCAERGRWGGESDEFGWIGALAPPRLRGMAGSASQEDVWGEIEEVQRAFPERLPDTTSYGAIARSRRVDGRLDELRGRAVRGRVTGADRIGVVCAVDGRIVGVDIYGNPGLFTSMWPQLLNSYLIEAIRMGSGDERSATSADARRAIESIRDARRRAVRSIGMGDTFELSVGRDATGAALTLDGRLVHLSAVSTARPPRVLKGRSRLR